MCIRDRLVCVPFKIIFPAAVLIHGGCAFFMASFAFRLKKGGLLVKTILALYFTAFVVGGIYQALETERTMTVKIFLLFLAGIYGTLYTLGCVTETFRFGRRNIFPVTLKYQGKLQDVYKRQLRSFRDGNAISVESKNMRIFRRTAENM